MPTWRGVCKIKISRDRHHRRSLGSYIHLRNLRNIKIQGRRRSSLRMSIVNSTPPRHRKEALTSYHYSIDQLQHQALSAERYPRPDSPRSLGTRGWAPRARVKFKFHFYRLPRVAARASWTRDRGNSRTATTEREKKIARSFPIGQCYSEGVGLEARPLVSPRELFIPAHRRGPQGRHTRLPCYVETLSMHSSPLSRKHISSFSCEHVALRE